MDPASTGHGVVNSGRINRTPEVVIGGGHRKGMVRITLINGQHSLEPWEWFQAAQVSIWTSKLDGTRR